MNDFLNLAQTRRSVRTFDGNRPSAEILNELVKYASGITNPFCSQVRFEFLDAEKNNLSSPVLAGEKCYVSAVLKKGSHADEGYGYSFEKLLIKAHELGLGTVWIGGTMPREKFETASHLEADEAMPCVSPLGVPAKKMSIKESLMRKGVKADSRYDFEKLFFKGDFNTPLTKGEAAGLGLANTLEAVRIAPSAVNKQPWRVVIEGRNAHFYVKHDQGFANPDYDLQKIDLGIALFHFESQLISEGRSAEYSTNAPEISVPEQTEYVATITF